MTTTEPIERVVLTHLQIPFKEPFRISAGEVATKDAILVEVETARGVGLGESSPMAASFGYSPDTPEGCWEDLANTIAPSFSAGRWRPPTTSRRSASSWNTSRFAAAGAETALWDLLGQVRHATIAELLGASELRIDMGIEAGLAVGLYPSIVELIKTIEAHLEAGYRRVKIKIRPGEDIELVRAVRQHSAMSTLMVDANGAYTAADLDVFRELDQYDSLMFEQPMAPDDLDGLALLQQAVTTPVCLDETAESLERTAGRDRARRLAGSSTSRSSGSAGSARRWPSTTSATSTASPAGSVPCRSSASARRTAIHLATLPNCKYPADIEPSARWFVNDYTIPLIELAARASSSVPTRPGLGYHVDPVKVRRYQVVSRSSRPSPGHETHRLGLSAADRVHQPLGLDEAGRVDLVPLPLRGDAVADRARDRPRRCRRRGAGADVGLLEARTGSCGACRRP